MKSLVDRITDARDVDCCYALLFGRRPENAGIVKQYSGQPFLAFISTIVASEEFRAVADSVIKTSQLAQADQIGHVEYKRIAGWLEELTHSPVSQLTTSGWVLIKTLICLDDIAPLFDNGRLSVFYNIVLERADLAEAEANRLAPFLNFDINWLQRQSIDPAAILSDPAAPPFAYRIETDVLRRNLQLFPAVSEGLDQAYGPLKKDVSVPVRDVIDRLLHCLCSGIVSHWMFSDIFYRSEPDGVRAEAVDRSATSKLLYLDFLTQEPPYVRSPHPLFNNYSYRSLNKDIDLQDISPFHHYITEGCFDMRPTSAIFDQEFYLASNRSARIALSDGTHVSALHHFLTFGIFHDLAFCPDLDLGFYRQRYPDIIPAAGSATMPSATWHFVFFGLAEGRMPNPYFDPEYYRQRHPHAAMERQRLGIGSDLEHFLLLGKARGYKPGRPLASQKPPIDMAKAIFQRRARRSLNNVIRSPLDFSFDVSLKPAISVIIPVFNEIEFTSRFLECAYFAASHFQHMIKRSVEIIVVSNGSVDGTTKLLRSCSGVKVLDFSEPTGFPRAVNAGVAASSGELIIVANNDIEFDPSTFLKVFRRLSDNDAIGIVGGLAILPNETLQEAGSFLNSHGGVMGLGRNENPWDQYFQGVHRADYCSGCFIGFRRKDFDALGGFDEEFSPGYYEETDFAFRMTETLGKKAVVDSELQITHFEHASFGKGRPPTAAFSLIARNQARFVNKHRSYVSRLPMPSALGGVEGVNPTAINRTRVLVVEDLMPDPKLGSGFVRSYHTLSSLGDRGVPYDLLVLNPNSIADEFNDPRVAVYRAWMPGENVEAILSEKVARYSHIFVCRTHNLTAFSHFLESARHRYGIQIICDTEALGSLRRLEMKRLSGKAVTEAEVLATVRLELDAPVQVSHWIAVSPYEKELIEAAGFGPVSLFCHSFEQVPIALTTGWHERTRITAVGAVHEHGSPNHDGLVWFMNNVYPKCRSAISDLALTIVGHWRSDVWDSFRQRYPDADIDFKGSVSDDELRRIYDESRMTLAPTRFAAGVASKVLEAMSLGVPVVMTDLLEKQLVGTALAGRSDLAVGARNDDGRSFAGWVEVMAHDERRWNDLRRRQLELVEPLGGRAAFEDGVDTLLRSVGIAHRARL